MGFMAWPVVMAKSIKIATQLIPLMKWDIDEASGLLWVAGEVARSLCDTMKEKLGICFTKHMSYFHKNNFKWCTLESENEKVGNFLVDRFKNKAWAAAFVKDYTAFDKATIKELDALDKKDFSKLDTAGIFHILDHTAALYRRNFDFGFIIEPMDFVLPGMMQERLKKAGYTTEEITDMLAIADTTFFNREMQDLSALAKKPSADHAGLLAKHAWKYRWLKSGYFGRVDIPLSHFQERLQELLKKGSLNDECEKLARLKKNTLARKKELMKKKPLDAETQQLVAIINLIAPFHDRRKELFLRIVYTHDTTRGEIAKRYGYTKEELGVFEAQDLLPLKEGKKLDKNYAHQLAEEALLVVDTPKGVWKYYHGAEARRIIEKELVVDVAGVTEIRGMPAHLGTATGTVTILRGIEDVPKMKKGNILVSPMTKPDYLPALAQAAAIVTDEGGVTCHAAIVSRELGIPCIIGTKIASRVLKDGDTVEVDAGKGLVRKIK